MSHILKLISRNKVIAMVLLACLIILPNITRESFELDEIFSVHAIVNSDSIKTLLEKHIKGDGNPPLFYFLQFFWHKFFGASELKIRVLSLLATFLGIFISNQIFARNFNRKIANIYSFLCLFNPAIIFYSQQARMYSFLYALTCILVALLMVLKKKIVKRQKISMSLKFSYFLLGVSLSLTHHFGMITFYSSLVLILYFINRTGNTNLFVELLSIGFLVGLCYVTWPIYQYLSAGMERHLKEFSFSRTNIISLIQSFSTFIALNKYGVVIISITLLQIFRKFGFVRFILENKDMIFFAVVIISLGYLMSALLFTLEPRYLIVLLPIIFLVFARILSTLIETHRGLIYLFFCTMFLLSGIKSFTYSKQDWRSAAKFIMSKVNMTDCKIPLRHKDEGFDRSKFVSFYLEKGYEFEALGPKIQEKCDIIYVDGHTNLEHVKNTLDRYKIDCKYRILNFDKVFVVMKI